MHQHNNTRMYPRPVIYSDSEKGVALLGTRYKRLNTGNIMVSPIDLLANRNLGIAVVVGY